MKNITEQDSDNLADIIWWIKGYLVAKSVDCDYTDLNNEHVESLRKFRIAFREFEAQASTADGRTPSNKNKRKQTQTKQCKTH